MTTTRTTTAPTKRKRKGKVAIVAAVLVGAASVGAYAYWSSTGAGTGSAASGNVVGITINQDPLTGTLAPGVTALTLEGDFTNTNASPVYITSVTASISSVVKAAGAPAGTCDATNYSLTAETVNIGREIAPGTNVDSWSGPQLEFVNKATNQDACKGATVNLAYSAS